MNMKKSRITWDYATKINQIIGKWKKKSLLSVNKHNRQNIFLEELHSGQNVEFYSGYKIKICPDWQHSTSKCILKWLLYQ